MTPQLQACAHVIQGTDKVVSLGIGSPLKGRQGRLHCAMKLEAMKGEALHLKLQSQSYQNRSQDVSVEP